MPYLRVRIATSQSSTTAQQVATMLTDLAVSKLGKNAQAAAVDVQFTDPTQWFIGGQALAATDATSFVVEIKLTEHTNSRDQLAGFIKATYDGMAALFPHVATTSYVVCQFVGADSWGYGGKTQAYRYITGDND